MDSLQHREIIQAIIDVKEKLEETNVLLIRLLEEDEEEEEQKRITPQDESDDDDNEEGYNKVNKNVEVEPKRIKFSNKEDL